MANGDSGRQEQDEAVPSLFATVHFRSERRPDGYTDEEITDLNKLPNPAANDAG